MLAEDVLGQKGSIIEQISTLKISNIPIGKQFVGLLNSADKQSNTSDNKPKVIKIKRVRYCEKFSIIMLVMPLSLQFWRFYDGSSYMTPVLVHEQQFQQESDNDILDITIIGSEPSICYVVLHKRKDGAYKLSRTCVDGSSPVVERESQGSPTHFCHNDDHLLVGHVNGMIRVFSMGSLAVVAEVQGLVGQRVIMDIGRRWLAYETINTNNIWNQTQSKMNEWMTGKGTACPSGSSESTGGAVGGDIVDVTGNMVDNSEDLVRLAISSAYQVGKFSWDSVSPYLQQGQGHQGAPGNVPAKPVVAEGSDRGGCIHIVDLAFPSKPEGTTDERQESSRDVSGKAEVKSLAKFIAHSTNLTCIRFSASGLKIASSDANGQVVHVHSLCKAGSNLCSRVRMKAAAETQSRYVQLLYKIHRGLTLVSIVNLRFSADDSLLSVVSTNNTMHIFGMVPAADAGDPGANSLALAAASAADDATSGKPVPPNTGAEPAANAPKASAAAPTGGKKKKGKSKETVNIPAVRDVEASESLEEAPESPEYIVPSQVNVSALVSQHQQRPPVGAEGGRPVNTNITSTVQAYSNARTTIPERFVLPAVSNEPNGAAAVTTVGDSSGEDTADNAGLGANYAFSFIHRDYAAESASGTKGQPGKAAEYVVLCVTSQGFVCRYTCKRPLSPSSTSAPFEATGGPGISPPLPSSGTQSANSTSTGSAASFGSAFNSPLDAPLAGLVAPYGAPVSTNTVYELRETNRWDLLTSTRTLKKGTPTSLPCAETAAAKVVGDQADSYNINIKRISWLSTVTQHDHLLSRHQTDLSISDTVELLPCWRRRNISVSIASASTSVRAAGSGSVVPSKVAGIANTSTIPVVSLSENALVSLRLDVVPGANLYDQLLEGAQSNAGDGSTAVKSSKARVTHNAGVASAISMHAGAGVSTDDVLNKDKEEFQQRQEQLRLQRLQQAMANNIEIFDMDDADWLSCEPQTLQSNPRPT